jgi:formate hydrogenlyase subunit 3/multisubunit Na+/H+ antiporter MnhD subunit
MVAWELMAVTSILLLVAEHRHRAEARDAAQWYAAMTHIGAAAILLGLVILAAHAGSQSFTAIRLHNHDLSPTIRSLVFVLVLVGFASKAGAVPLHVWLPRAHAEAPTPVSALMSGAMVNLGIYGIVRVGDGLLGGGVLWWWLLVLSLGVISALFGAVHAAASSDLKRLLAYSTIDNVGLILIGVGAAGALSVTGYHLLAALAMLAALFHLANHAAFKGCLFLAAGSVQHATGTRNLDRLGGLVHRLPATALLFGIASFSISALPPFNGFASEWLLLQGLLHGFATHNTVTEMALLAGVAALALTGGLTAAAFVKALGIGFLGQPRTPESATAHEVAPSMIVGTAFLAVPCVVLGVVPGLVMPMLRRATDTGLGVISPNSIRAGLGLNLVGFAGAIEPALLLIAVLAALALTWGVVQLFARHSARRTEAWGCGRELLTPRMEYTATSFAEPLQRVFVDVLRPSHDPEVTHVAESRYFEHAISYRSEIDDALERSCYRPVIGFFMAWGNIARRAQNGSAHRYLAFGFFALVVVLIVLA